MDLCNKHLVTSLHKKWPISIWPQQPWLLLAKWDSFFKSSQYINTYSPSKQPILYWTYPDILLSRYELLIFFLFLENIINMTQLYHEGLKWPLHKDAWWCGGHLSGWLSSWFVLHVRHRCFGQPAWIAAFGSISYLWAWTRLQLTWAVIVISLG